MSYPPNPGWGGNQLANSMDRLGISSGGVQQHHATAQSTFPAAPSASSGYPPAGGGNPYGSQPGGSAYPPAAASGYPPPAASGYPPALSGAYPPLQQQLPNDKGPGHYPPLHTGGQQQQQQQPGAAAAYPPPPFASGNSDSAPSAPAYPPAAPAGGAAPAAAPSGYPPLASASGGAPPAGAAAPAPGGWPGLGHAGGGMGVAAGAPAAAAPMPGGGWRLREPLPQRPAQQLIGPFLRFNDYDPASGYYSVSALVVAHPDTRGQVQVHFGVNGPANNPTSATLLDEYMGFRFTRFDMGLELLEAPAVMTYTVGLVGAPAPASTHSVHLPARGEAWRWLFYSCNGFHEGAVEAKYGGIGHMWSDLMQRHDQMKFHLQVGGGDQIYCDDVWSLPAVLPWVAIDDPHVRACEPFSAVMLDEAEQYYFGHYCRHFTGDANFARGLATIPYTYTWDDHDIFDGWGSYPEYLQNSAVFQGLFAVARRFFLLFQMHANHANAAQISRTIGHGAYHQVRSVGPNIVLVAPDTRSQRHATQVVQPLDWKHMLDEAERRIQASAGRVHHLVVLLAIPIVYPKIPVAESAIAGISGALARSSEMRDALRKAGIGGGGMLNQFMEADLLDDLKDHWTAAEHVKEREFLIRRLQHLAAEHRVRVTFTSGDVHVGAYGCLQGHPKVPDRVVDPKFMLQVVSSAVGNEPPPVGVVKALETSSMASTKLVDTLEKMIKAFPDKRKLWGGRNYCEVFCLSAPYTEPSTGIPQPPGGLMFALRCETGAPGRWGPVEAHWQVAPLLIPSGNPAIQSIPGGYGAIATNRAGAGAGGSVLGGAAAAVAGLLPAEHGAKLQSELKKAGHKLGNFLQRF